MRNSIKLLNRRNIGINIEINCTYLNLDLLLLFLCNLSSIHGPFIRFCGSLFVRCCFPTQNEARKVTMCRLNSQISPASKNRAPIHSESAKSLRPGQSLISSPRHGYCDVLCVEKFFQSFWFWVIWRVLRNLDDYVLRGEREHCIQLFPERYCGWLLRTVLNIALFLTFFKGYRCNKLSVITPMTISHGSPRTDDLEEDQTGWLNRKNFYL